MANNESDELIDANKKLAVQDKEKGERAAELIIANKELVFQNKEKEKRAAELVIANKELAVPTTTPWRWPRPRPTSATI